MGSGDWGKAASGLRTYLNAAVAVRALPGPAWAGAAVFAAERLLLGTHPLLSGLTGLAVTVAGSAALARSHTWSEGEAAVVLDGLAQAGGLSLALREASGPDWEARIQGRLQNVRYPSQQVGRPALLTGGALLFAVLAALFARVPRPTSAPQAAAQAKVDALISKSAVLAQEEPLPGALQAELQRLEQEAKQGQFDASDWATADAAEEAMDQAAKQRAQELAQAKAAADQLASSLADNAPKEAEAQAREALENALTQLDQTGSGKDGKDGEDGKDSKDGKEGESKDGKDGQSKDGKEGKDGKDGKQGKEGKDGQPGKEGQDGQGKEGQPGKDGKPSKSGKSSSSKVKSPADAKALAKALKQRQKALQNGFQQPGQGEKDGEGDGEGEDGEGKEGKDGKPGKDGKSKGKSKGGPTTGGGVSRDDPSDTPVTYGDAAPDVSDQLKAKGLNMSDIGDPGELNGIVAATPDKVGHGPNTSAGNTAPVAGADGVATSQSQVAPRLRPLVQKYFSAGSPPKGTAP
jgi:hypothetical protein